MFLNPLPCPDRRAVQSRLRGWPSADCQDNQVKRKDNTAHLSRCICARKSQNLGFPPILKIPKTRKKSCCMIRNNWSFLRFPLTQRMYQVRLLVYIISMYVGIYTWERGRTASDLTAQNSSKVEGKKKAIFPVWIRVGNRPQCIIMQREHWSIRLQATLTGASPLDIFNWKCVSLAKVQSY